MRLHHAGAASLLAIAMRVLTTEVVIAAFVVVAVPARAADRTITHIPGAPAPSVQVGIPDDRAIGYSFRTMGTTATIAIVTRDSVRTAGDAERAGRFFAHVDSAMSNWTESSELARVNRELADGAVVLDPELALVLDTALTVGRESEGAFDVTIEPLVRLWGFLGGPKRVPSHKEIDRVRGGVGQTRLLLDRGTRVLAVAASADAEVPPPRIDLGGIAKGYAVDGAARVLQTRGVLDALVDISGNMYAFGSPPGREFWSIGIRDPRDRVSYFVRVPLRDRAVSTSAQYEQFVMHEGRRLGHILDPRTGWPVEGVLSVTVLAPSAVLADAWSTALFVLGGREGRRVARERGELDAIFVLPGAGEVDTVWVETPLARELRLEPGAAAHFVLRTF